MRYRIDKRVFDCLNHLCIFKQKKIREAEKENVKERKKKPLVIATVVNLCLNFVQVFKKY